MVDLELRARRGGRHSMSHSYSQNLLHCVYGTWNRRDSIPTELLEHLWAYNIGIGRNKGIPVIAAGGIENHIHLCIGLPPTIRLADALSVFKSNSSRWLKDQGVKGFSWQIGYGAFSVSPSPIAAVQRYIRNQREHHKKRTFEEEFLDLLKRSGVDYDPRHVFE
jgi:REP element-mobilizing transposase RayT